MTYRCINLSQYVLEFNKLVTYLILIIKIMKNKEFIYFTKPKINKNTITFYGAGKFSEENLTLNKEQAKLAYIELHKFLFNINN